jgi:hypothetical protein
MFFQAHHSIDRNLGYYSTNDASSTIYIYIYIYKGRSAPLKQEEKKKLTRMRACLGSMSINLKTKKNLFIYFLILLFNNNFFSSSGLN